MSLEANVNNTGVNTNHHFDNLTLPILKSCTVLAIKLFECLLKLVLSNVSLSFCLCRPMCEAAGCWHINEKFYHACLEYHSADLPEHLVVCFCQITFIFTNYADTKVPTWQHNLVGLARRPVLPMDTWVLIVRFMAFLILFLNCSRIFKIKNLRNYCRTQRCRWHIYQSAIKVRVCWNTEKL